MLYRPAKETMWDTWIFPYQGEYYLFYIRVGERGTRWDGVSLAVSHDLLHWTERGTVLKKSEDAVWLGTGMVQRMEDRFIMNFSEERPAGHQVICFAQSRDLINWERLDEELRPDPKWYLTRSDGACDFMYRWDSIGIVDAHTPHEPPYYGFTTASVPAALPGKTGALGVVKSEDGVHWECMKPACTSDAFTAYEVPEHVCFNGRHYVIFSTTSYLFGRFGRSRFLEGGCYYVASDKMLEGYALPPCDPMLIGTRDNASPAMKTVARIIKAEGETLLYYQWGDLSGDAWAAVPLVLNEVRPWELGLFYWQGAERLKGELIANEGTLAPARALPDYIAPCVRWTDAPGSVKFENCGSAGGVFRNYPAAREGGLSDGRVVECALRVTEGIGAGFLLDNGDENAPYAVHLNFRDQTVEFGYARPGFGANLTIVSLMSSYARVAHGVRHGVRLIFRRAFAEIYVDDAYVNGFRFERAILPERVGFISDQSSGAFEDVRVWRMR